MVLINLKDLQIIKILAENPLNKSINILAKFKNRDGHAILLINKPPFSKDLIQELISEETSAQVQLENDIYSQYILTPKTELNQLQSTLIYPATEKHIDKYSRHALYIIHETPEDYRNITLPYIEDNAFSAQVNVEYVTSSITSFNISLIKQVFYIALPIGIAVMKFQF